MDSQSGERMVDKKLKKLKFADDMVDGFMKQWNQLHVTVAVLNIWAKDLTKLKNQFNHQIVWLSLLDLGLL